jgi:hypothetical protein
MIFHSIGWTALTEALFTIFMDFFDTCAGGGDTFTWYDNSKGTPIAYTVRFAADSIRWDMVSYNRYKVTFDLEEV